MRLPSAGHAAFAATMVGLGVLGLVQQKFTVIWEPVPDHLPGRTALACVCAVVCLATGLGLLWQRTARASAAVLLGYQLLWMAVFRLPPLFHSIAVDVYWAACKTAVVLAAAWVLYIRFASGFAAGKWGLRVARGLYGAAMVPFGIAHFQYAKQTASLVPGWLPGHLAWAYVTGGAFVAAGLAVLAAVFARLAVTLSAVQMGLFLLLVWVPVVVRGGASAFQWSETIVSWVLTAAAWVVADSYRGRAWLEIGWE